MARRNRVSSGWRGVCLIAITYVYFLIFAQFAFLKRLQALGIADAHLKAIMAAMALGGTLLSLLAPRLVPSAPGGVRMRVALVGCAAAAFLSLLPLNFPAALGVSLLIGCALGLLTVTLVTHLRAWIGQGDALLNVGVGAGLGYFLCNVPPFFAAGAATQAVVAGCLCSAGVLLTWKQRETSTTAAEPLALSGSSPGFPRVLCCFTALVWLDSAAFFIIQNTPALKAGTWAGTLHLWANGALHFAAALVSVSVLRRGGLIRVLSLAFFALGAACLLLLDPSRALPASMLYPVGVSLYSVALVAYPSLLTEASSTAERGRRAGWIYAVAGWFGSAMGIGMGQNLGRVPPAFVIAAGTIVLGSGLLPRLRRRKREAIAVAAVLMVALCIDRAVIAVRAAGAPLSPIERGRVVYTSEGCINCHSQYVRPRTADVLMWGPAQSIEELRARPVVIGNRRQGPDLAEVGSRRSPLWLKAHFYSPSQVSHASFMPSYAYLFRNGRGDDLTAYLQSLRSEDVKARRLAEAAWSPAPSAIEHVDPQDGARLFRLYCATCHAEDGATRLAWTGEFKTLPPDLKRDPYLLHLRSSDPATGAGTQGLDMLARIVKFGLPGTDMPGHEYLPDAEITSISRWLLQTVAQPTVAHNLAPEHKQGAFLSQRPGERP